MAGLMAIRATAMKKKDKTKAQQAMGTKAFAFTIPSPKRDKRKKTLAQKPMYPPRHKGQTQTSTHSRVRQRKSSRNDVKARKKQTQTEWSMHKGPRHHLLVYNQYRGGGS